MNSFKHFCPYCSSQLQIRESEEERYAAKCPTCQKVIVVKNHGQSLSKPFVYKCPKCGKEHMFYDQITSFICDGCNTILLASEKGTCLIEPELLKKGDNGELPYKKKVDKRVLFYNKWVGKPTKTKVGIISSLIMAIAAIVLICYIVTPCAIEKTLAYADESELWKEFREKNPINYQTAGIKAYDDNSYNILLSEPSPTISEKQLESFIKKYHGKVITHQCAMGIDGWLKDAVLCFNGVRQSKIDTFRSTLFELLYGTDYKACFEPLDTITGHTNFIKETVNYQISAEELQKWFVDDRQILIKSDTNEETVLEDILLYNRCGIYYTKEPGMVIWVINRIGDTPKEFDIPARIFALDADLILGAIGTKNSIAVIGRERQMSLHEMPPMRVETMKILAATQKEELSQSYERNNIVAGKMNGGKDYAPILLSPELWHTEYGSMLNVTDQMLKSWSENGQIEYETFVYPKPYEWAFVESAMEDLQVQELTYNWNTSGAGYTFEADEDNPYMIYAINRTGSLPVSYIPGDTDDIGENDKVFQAEENAYDFFSGLACPELIKVVQYASLYQIFINYDYHLDYFPDTYSINTSIAEEKIKSALNSITKFGDKEKEFIRNDIKTDFNEMENELELLRAIPEDQMTKEQKSRYIELLIYTIFTEPSEVAESRIAEFDSLRTTIDYYSDATLNSRIAHYLVNPREIDFEAISHIVTGGNADNLTNEDISQCYALFLLDEVEHIKRYNMFFHLFDLEQIRDDYIEDNMFSHSNWIKCPTVVQSWSVRDSVNQTGGHNLNSHITPVKIDKSLAKGQCKIEKLPDGSKEIRISPADKGQVTPSFLRNVERTGKIGRQKFAEAPRVPRALSEVFPSTSRTIRGFDPASQVCRVSRTENAFTINGKNVTDVDAFWKELAVAPKEETSVHQIVFENFSQDEVRLIMDGKPSVIIKKGEASRTTMEDLDFTHMSISENTADGSVTVLIPKKSQNIVTGIGSERQEIPIQLRSASMGIQFPAKSKAGWLKTIRELFIDQDSGEWSIFRLQRQGRKNGLDPNEAKELKLYKIANNKLINSYDHAIYIQTKIA